jgi:hypothetical protein
VKINRTFAVLWLVLAGIVSLRAQPAAVQQFQNLQLSQQQQTILTNLAAGKAAPELYQGENVDVGPQRILRLNPRPLYFDVLLDSQAFYTDNANFAQDPAMIGSTVFVNTLQAALAPPDFRLGAGTVSLTAGLASQWYNYENNRMVALDFDAQTAFIGGKYTVGKWQVGFTADYTRLVSQSDYSATYREILPVLTLQRVFPLNEKMLIALGNQVDYHFSDTDSAFGIRGDINDRFDDAIELTFSWQVMPHLILQPYYRFQYSYYRFNTEQTSDRNDYLQTAGVTVAYYFNPVASLRVFFSYNRKQSNDPFTPAYLELGGGLGASLNFKF